MNIFITFLCISYINSTFISFEWIGNGFELLFSDWLDKIGIRKLVFICETIDDMHTHTDTHKPSVKMKWTYFTMNFISWNLEKRSILYIECISKQFHFEWMHSVSSFEWTILFWWFAFLSQRLYFHLPF